MHRLGRRPPAISYSVRGHRAPRARRVALDGLSQAIDSVSDSPACRGVLAASVARHALAEPAVVLTGAGVDQGGPIGKVYARGARSSGWSRFLPPQPREGLRTGEIPSIALLPSGRGAAEMLRIPRDLAISTGFAGCIDSRPIQLRRADTPALLFDRRTLLNAVRPDA
jgi:hypothetical protein